MEYKEEQRQKAYLVGYKSGFEAALKMSWALAEELLISVDNTDKPSVQEFIDKIRS